MLVSIIVPIYNSEEYLISCLESIVGQTIFSEIELILINDGSTDNSEQICLSFCNKFPNIKYYYQDNQGVSSARNKGLKKAQGDYVYFMDSDDTINNIFIEKALEIACRTKSDIVVVSENMWKHSKPLCALATWQAFWRHDFLKQHNDIYFCHQLAFAEDPLFSCQLISLTDKIVYEPESMYFYRKHNNSLYNSQKSTAQLFINNIDIIFNELKNFYFRYKNLPKVKIQICRFIAYFVFFKSYVEKFNILARITIYSKIFKFLKDMGFFYIPYYKEASFKYKMLYFLFNVLFSPTLFFYYLDKICLKLKPIKKIIIGIYKSLKFVILNLINIIGSKFLSIIFKKKSNIVVLGCCPLKQTAFLHNTKYLYLYLNNKTDYNTIWICENSLMREKFIKKGYKHVYSKNSLKGLYFSLKAKYFFTDFTLNDILNSITFRAGICINLWHGIPLKKIGHDDNYTKFANLPLWKKTIHNLLIYKDNYYISNNEYEQNCYETAFLASKNKIKILGSPRLDVLFHGFPNEDLFMEEDYAKIKSLKEQGKKLFFYTPTFRDTGKDISGWLKSEKLKLFLQKNNIILVCKLHPFDKNSLKFELTENFYKMDNVSDVYPILKYTDCLISDYSSVYFDYLLLDKPILYYVPDLEEYQEQCRGFYGPYEELTAGIKSKNEEELLKAMQDVINGIDNYKEQRKVLRDKMFKYQDGRNCERVLEWIKSLDK